MKDEIWKDIPNYEGLYQASNYGRIKSLSRIINHKSTGKVISKEKILKSHTNYGYKNVLLSKNNEKKYKKIHRLVAETFIPNPNNLPYINHTNENRSDNRVENLEWCDSKYNNNYGNHPNSRKKYIKCIETGEIFLSARKAAEAYHTSHSCIARVCNGERKTTLGKHWEWIEENDTN